MPFSPAGLLPFIARLTHASRYFVAYSGGADSHVLLHALAQLREQLPGVVLRAIHVHHGLHSSAADWAQHCERVCAALGVVCDVRCVDARAPSGVSPEAAARTARYAVFAELLQVGDVLFTAHHQDDQAETLLLQLLRGAGPRGLAGMAELSRFGTAWLARPLLEFSRAALLEYGLAQKLSWVDDPSNTDTRFDRNYLRHEILPRLSQRWPAAHVTLARSAQHCAEAAELLAVLAQQDLQYVRIDSLSEISENVRHKYLIRLPSTAEQSVPSHYQGEGVKIQQIRKSTQIPQSQAILLSVTQLLQLSVARQRNLLRVWIEHAGLPSPQQRQLEQLQCDVLHTSIDAEPCMRWPGAEVRRYRDALVAMPPLPPFDAAQQWQWNLDVPLHIAHVGILTACRRQGTGLRADVCTKGVRVGFRSGGERIQPAGRAHHATLKNLFQQAGVPPWLRERVPLVYIDGGLAAVVGYWYAEEFAAPPGVAAVTIELQSE